MFALIIAGGYASRLRPYSDTLPKSLMELEQGVTLLDYITNVMKELGIEKSS